MKVTKFSTLLIASSLLLSAAAFAGPTNKKTLHLDTKITVDGKPLEPGDYTFEWTEGSPDVVLKVMQGKTVYASLPAKVVPVPNSNFQNGYELTVAADGSRSFTEISFSGKNTNCRSSHRPARAPHKAQIPPARPDHFIV